MCSGCLLGYGDHFHKRLRLPADQPDIKERMNMKVNNVKKTKTIIFNFSKKYKSSTQLSVDDENIELVNEAKLLGTFITDDLKWNKNIKEIVKKAYRRIQLLNRAANFSSN